MEKVERERPKRPARYVIKNTKQVDWDIEKCKKLTGATHATEVIRQALHCYRQKLESAQECSKVH